MSTLSGGAPHPHELVACLMIEQLIDRLCAGSEFRCALPHRWHFIKAIEPDALRLNEGSSPRRAICCASTKNASEAEWRQLVRWDEGAHRSR